MSHKNTPRGYSPFLLAVTVLAGAVIVYGLIRTGDIHVSLPRFTKPTPPPPRQVINTKPFSVTTNYPRVTDADHVSGRRNAHYIIVTYVDYDCEQCRAAYKQLKVYLSERKGDTALVVRHFPLDSHSNARVRAVAAECIAQRDGEQAFWKYTNELLTSDSDNEIVGEDCTENRDIARRLRADSESASQYGVGGLPALYLINTKTKKALFAVGLLSTQQLHTLAQQTK